MCVCVRVCAAWHNTRTHTHFLGGCSSNFFAVRRHKKLRRFGRIAHVNTPLPRAVASRRDLLLQLYCAGNAFCALHFIAASICFCKQALLPSLPALSLLAPFSPVPPFSLPTYRPTTPIRTDCREVWSLFHHTHTHTETCRAFSLSQMKLARGISGCGCRNIQYISTCSYVWYTQL